MHPFSVKKFASLAVLSSFFLLTHHVFSISASPASPATPATAATADEATLDATAPMILPKNNTTPNDNVTSDALKTTDKSTPKTHPAWNSLPLKKPSASKNGGNETIFGLLKTLNAQGISIDPNGLKNVNFVKLVSTLAQIIQYSTEGFSLGNDTTPLSKGPVAPGPEPGEVRLMFTLDPKFLSTNIVKFLPYPDRLEQPLNATLVKGLVEKVNDSGLFKNKFSPVPRAFATIVNRNEVSSLEKTAGIGIDEVVKIARENYIAYTQISIQCLALDSASGLLFLRVRAKEWTMTRKDLFNLLKKKKNDTSEETLKRDVFNPDLYSPNIVIATSLNATATVGEESFDHLALNSTKCLALVDASPIGDDEDDDVLLFQSSATSITTSNTTSFNTTSFNDTFVNGTSFNGTVTNGTSSNDSTNTNDAIASSTNTNAITNSTANSTNTSNTNTNTSNTNANANSTNNNETNTNSNSTNNATSA